MTVLTGALLYLAGWAVGLFLMFVVGFLLVLIHEALAFVAIVPGWCVIAVTQLFGILVLVFWIYAMFQGNNPLEAFNYEMWD